MPVPMKARYSISLKTLLAAAGVVFLSACAGSPTAPSAAPKVDVRASVIVPVGRSNFTGYVVAERDTTGRAKAIMMQGIGGTPADTASLSLGW